MRAESELALRQQQLLLRSAALRASLADQAVVLEAPFAVADRVRVAARWAWHRRVALIAGAAVVLIVMRPRRAWGLALFGWSAWRRAQRVRSWLVAAGLAGGAVAPAPHA